MANLVLKTNTVGNDVSVEMLRGDSYCDWRIVNTGGNLCMQANWTTAKVDYYNVLKLEYNTGAITAKGRITAPGITSSGQVFITSTNETALTANTGALLIGTASGTHLSLDANEIQAKSSGTAATTLNLNPHGGLIQIGAGGLSITGALEVGKTITATEKVTAPSFIGRLGRVRAYTAVADVDAALSSCGAQLEFSTVSAAATSLNNDGMLLTLGYSTSWGAQVFVDDGSGQPPKMAFRNRSASDTWGSWVNVITSAGGTISTNSLIIASTSKLVIPVKASTYTSSTAGEIWIVA